MAFSVKKIHPMVWVLGIGVTLYMLNWLFVYWMQFPFLYCTLEPVVSPVYFAFANIANVAVIAYLIWVAIRKRWIPFVGGCGILALVAGAPIFADIMFKMGGAC